MVRYESLECDPWDYETDVLVVGFGGAGGCAAIEAVDAGADVLVIEKQHEDTYYSNTRISGGGYHSPDPDGDREALVAYATAMFSGHNLPWKLEGELPEDLAEDLAEAWATYAPENEAWMRSLDPDYETVLEGTAAFPDFPGADACAYRVVRSTYSGGAENKEVCQKDAPKAEKEAGEAFYACLRHGVDERGIDVHWGAPAEEFVVDETGAVRGVAVAHDGETVYYGAGATVLTTGGFEYNRDLRLNFLEGAGVEGWAFYSNPANTGDGIVMSMEIGASLSKVGKSASRMITAIPVRKHGLKMGLRTPVVGRPNAIVVDNAGRRYASERTITKDPSRYFFYKKGVVFDIEALVYPRIPSWLIFDETLRSQRSVVGTRELGYHGIEWGERNETAIEKGWILEAPTVEALAEQIAAHPDNREAMDPETLATTVATYNGYCEAGVDEAFGNAPENMAPLRTPPFYAVPLYPGGPNTKGGLMANAEREVLDADGEAITNLYSAGEISSAFKFVYQGGGNLAECIAFGRIAGLNAAAAASSGDRS
ncbi:FAD-dependent oxidoreductase [Natronobiforma cellulositropha]|uniref:FAD-dependent oxidoreductase n=1 Tax=Natronobiforma cellulositropha TaxID=1679076 RepID=UPI0021D57E3C|nr:FAD-binding protein [Natronobiforma cellulositropha]